MHTKRKKLLFSLYIKYIHFILYLTRVFAKKFICAEMDSDRTLCIFHRWNSRSISRFFGTSFLCRARPAYSTPTIFCTRIKILFFPNIMRNACANRARFLPFRGKALQILYGNKTAGPHSDNRMSKIKGSTVKNTRWNSNNWQFKMSRAQPLLTHLRLLLDAIWISSSLTEEERKMRLCVF